MAGQYASRPSPPGAIWNWKPGQRPRFYRRCRSTTQARRTRRSRISGHAGIPLCPVGRKVPAMISWSACSASTRPIRTQRHPGNQGPAASQWLLNPDQCPLAANPAGCSMASTADQRHPARQHQPCPVRQAELGCQRCLRDLARHPRELRQEEGALRFRRDRQCLGRHPADRLAGSRLALFHRPVDRAAARHSGFAVLQTHVQRVEPLLRRQPALQDHARYQRLCDIRPLVQDRRHQPERRAD